jgi:hypothetical protein
MTVDSLFVKDIDKTFFEFRYKNISEYDKSNVDSVMVTQGDSILSLTRDVNQDWFLNGKIKVKSWKMNTLLTTINNLKAKTFLLENVSSPNRYGLTRPERKIEIFQHGKKIQSVIVSIHNDKKIAYSPGSNMIVEIETNSFDNLEVKVEDYIDTSVTDSKETS